MLQPISVLAVIAAAACIADSAIASTNGATESVQRLASKNTPSIDTEHYTIWTMPDYLPADVSTESIPGAGLIGGGPDCTEAFIWQIEHANLGDFVILRASGDDDYNDFVYELSKGLGKPLNSVATIVFKDRVASEEKEVLRLLENAEAIFLAGGDQNKYLDFWMGTSVQQLLQEKLSTVTLSGTSAGLAVLGAHIFSAKEGSVYSDECMENPFNKYVTLAPEPLLKIPFLESVLTDTHFGARDRMGRMLTFVARSIVSAQVPHHSTQKSSDLGTIVRGVGVDEETALLLNTINGSVTAVGRNSAYVCSPQMSERLNYREETETELTCLPDTPLTFTDLACVRLSGPEHSTFSFNTWTAIDPSSSSVAAYSLSVVEGKYTIDSLPYGPPPSHSISFSAPPSSSISNGD